MIRATLRQKIFDHKIFLKNKMFLIERSCRETFKNAITRHLIPSEDGEPPTPSWLFSVISGYFRLFRSYGNGPPDQRNKLLCRYRYVQGPPRK